MRIHILFLAAFLPLSPAWSAPTPEEIATDYFNDFRAGRIHAVTAAMHPDEMIKFKDLMLPVVAKGLVANDEQVGILGLRKLAGNESLDQLNAEAPEVFFTRFLAWLLAMDPTIKEMMAGARVEMLGHILEGETAHVVYRMQINVFGEKITSVDTIALKKLGDNWMLMLTGEIEGMSTILDANLKRLTP